MYWLLFPGLHLTLCLPTGCLDWLFLLFLTLPPPCVAQPAVLIGYFCCFQHYPHPGSPNRVC